MKKKNNTLPNLRIQSDLMKDINDCLESLNKNSAGIEIKLPQFRRLAYKDFVSRVRSEGLEFKFRPD